MAASRLENCRPLFNEWLNVARNARLDGDLDTEKMSVPSVLSEPAPQRVSVARKVKGRNSATPVFEPNAALAAKLMPARPSGNDLATNLALLRL